MPAPIHPLLAEVLAADADMLTHFGIEFVEAGEGTAVLRASPRREFVNSLGLAHGSLAFTLADTAAAYAMSSRGLHAATVNANVAFTGPIREGEEALARAEITTAGRTLATVTSTVTSDGKVAGHATFQFYILNDRTDG
ncbi:MAG: PaaI family thioesterase [Acidimicrobiia bacterium]|nr:PaaI family thioesterase [Acidimicrobiia bacterium]